jgi:hypothetical protein
MPWDLDSFLYADNDPAFTGRSLDKSLFTRAAQEPALKKLNQLAYETYQTPQIVLNTTIDRFDAPKKLVEKWYGGAGLPNAKYDDTATSSGWAGQDTLYHKVFARNCRACHTQNAVPDQQFTEYQKFVDTEIKSPTNITKTVQRLAYHDGRMPLARLTMDRFWVDYDNGDSAAKVLATHIQQVATDTDLLVANQPVPPGAPIPNVLINESAALSTLAVNRFTDVHVNASSSLYSSTYVWSLCLIPPDGGACAVQPLVGSRSSMPAFYVGKSGDYTLSLAANNGNGGTSNATYVVHVPNATPDLSACPASSGAALGQPLTIDLSTCATRGDGQPIVQIQDPQSGAWQSQVDAQNYTATAGILSLVFEYKTTATAPASQLSYRLCDADSECASITAIIPIVTTITAVANKSYTVNLPSLFAAYPTVPLSIPVSDLLAAVLPANDNVTFAVTSVPSGSDTLTPSGSRNGPPLSYGSSRVTCDIGGADIEPGTISCGNSFAFQLTSSDGSSHTVPTTATVNVRATTSFSQGVSAIHTIMGNGGNCTNGSCHASTTALNVARSFWTYFAASPSATLSSITGSANGPLIDTGTPINSLLYVTPCDQTSSHTGGHPLSSTECQRLLQWITEGAHLK